MGQGPRPHSRSDQQAVELDLLAVSQPHTFAFHIQPGRGMPQQPLHVELARAGESSTFRRHPTVQDLFGQWRPVVGLIWFVADERQRTAEALLAQRGSGTDRRIVLLRRLRPGDAPRLIDLRKRLSPETVRRRFLRDRPDCDPREAEALAHVDQVSRVAFAAVPILGAGGPIVAVGRYHVEDGKRADLALVVEDAYQHVGLGRVLLARLIAEATRRRLDTFEGHVLIENRPVLQLLRGTQRPLEVRYATGGDVLEVYLDIRPADKRRSAGKPLFPEDVAAAMS